MEFVELKEEIMLNMQLKIFKRTFLKAKLQSMTLNSSNMQKLLKKRLNLKMIILFIVFFYSGQNALSSQNVLIVITQIQLGYQIEETINKFTQSLTTTKNQEFIKQVDIMFLFQTQEIPKILIKQLQDQFFKKSAVGKRSRLRSAYKQCNIVKTNLGPRGLDKMLVMKLEMLQEQMMEQPFQNNQKLTSSCQNKEVGDGTTPVVILSAELFHCSNELIKIKVHPTTIISGYKLAARQAVKYIQSHLVHKITKDDTEILINTSSSLHFCRISGEDIETFQANNQDPNQLESDEIQYELKEIKVVIKYVFDKFQDKQSKEEIRYNNIRNIQKILQKLFLINYNNVINNECIWKVIVYFVYVVNL